MSTVLVSNTPLTNLDEFVAENNSSWLADFPIPKAPVVSGSREQSAIVAIDLSSLSTHVRNGGVRAIDIANTPITDLNEAIAIFERANVHLAIA